MPLFNRRSVVPEAVTTVEEPYYPPPPGPPPPLTDEEREHQAQFLADRERLLAAFDGQLPPTSDIYPPPPGPPPPLEECLYPENPEKYQKRSVTASLIRLSRPIVTFALLVLTCIGINEKFPHHPIVKHAKFVHKEAVGALNGEHSYKITVSKEAKEKTVSSCVVMIHLSYMSLLYSYVSLLYSEHISCLSICNHHFTSITYTTVSIFLSRSSERN